MRPVRTLVLILMIVMALTGTCFAAETYTVYKNTVHSFDMLYPTDWKLIEGFMGTVVAFSSPLENSADQFSENLNIVIQDLDANRSITPEQFENASLTQLREITTDFSLISKETYIISGIPTRVIVFSGKQGIFQLIWKQYYFIADDKAYVITYTAEQKNFNRYTDIARRIVSSFFLTKQIEGPVL